jgi:hypothetical protein
MSIDDIASPIPSRQSRTTSAGSAPSNSRSGSAPNWSGLGHDQVRVWVEKGGPQRLVGPEANLAGGTAASVVEIGDLDQHVGMAGHVERTPAAQVAAAEPRAFTSSDLGRQRPVLGGAPGSFARMSRSMRMRCDSRLT